MREITGDLFEQHSDAIGLTTNGFTRRDGLAVMGRGCARQAATRWPELPSLLGRALRERGNRVHLLTKPGPDGQPRLGGRYLPYHVFSFPVKPDWGSGEPGRIVRHMRAEFAGAARVPGWAAVADPEIIAASCRDAVALADRMGWRSIVLPRPGCGAGELDWARDVASIVRALLDDRFAVITWPARR